MNLRSAAGKLSFAVVTAALAGETKMSIQASEIVLQTAYDTTMGLDCAKTLRAISHSFKMRRAGIRN